MSEIAPVKLDKTVRRTLVIQWSDGSSQEIAFRQLRNACPCAVCTKKAEEQVETPAPISTSLPVLTDAEARPLEIVSMHPVGNYGYNIRFSDGHATGIYPLDLIRSLDLSE